MNDANFFKSDSAFSVKKIIFDEVQEQIKLIKYQHKTPIDYSVKLGILH